MDIRFLMTPPNLFTCKRVLCIQPHPDDNELGMGATVVKLVARGCEVSYLTVTNGDLGGGMLSRAETARIRSEELVAAGKTLGVTDFHALGYPDGSLEVVNPLAADICGVLRKVRPQAVFCPDPWLPYEAHADHRITGLAVSKAIMSCGLLHYETPEPSEPCEIEMVGYYFTDRPNMTVDVSGLLPLKFEAVSRHVSQMGGGTLDMFRTYFTAKAEELGRAMGFEAGEGFKLLRPLHLHCFVDTDKVR